MLKSILLLCLTSVVAVSAIFLPVVSADSAEQEVRNLEERWLQHEDDPAALESILAPDFIHVGPYGFVTRQQQLDFMRKHPRANSQKRSFEDLGIRLYGDVAIANGIVRATGPAATDLKRTVFTDVLVRRHGTWRAVNAQELPLGAAK